MVKTLFVILGISLKVQLCFASQTQLNLSSQPSSEENILAQTILKEIKSNTGALISRIRREKIGSNDIGNYAEKYAEELKSYMNIFDIVSKHLDHEVFTSTLNKGKSTLKLYQKALDGNFVMKEVSHSKKTLRADLRIEIPHLNLDEKLANRAESPVDEALLAPRAVDAREWTARD